MDEAFGPVALSIYAGDIETLEAQLDSDLNWATRRSSCGHPTLLQLVACEAKSLPRPVEAARALVDAGAETDGPLIAAAGCNSGSVVTLLLDRGADIDGDGHWSPLDEALYWAHAEMAAALVDRGARVRALSTAAGLGAAYLSPFFEGGSRRDEAGPIGSPFVDTVPPELAMNSQSILDHAFVMAVNCGGREAAEMLLGRGAAINARPPGYHWRGTALHAACWRGDEGLVRWLLAQGADPELRDGLANSDAPGWARHHGHDHLLELWT